ncbi:hypothetical protein GCM10027601_23710 [Nocardioides ungokensis]
MTPEVAVLRVVNFAPQVQVTWVSTYSGWMSFFMRCPLSTVAGSPPPGAGRVNRNQLAMMPPLTTQW